MYTLNGEFGDMANKKNSPPYHVVVLLLLHGICFVLLLSGHVVAHNHGHHSITTSFAPIIMVHQLKLYVVGTLYQYYYFSSI